jgi:hypothetical protein
MKKMKKKNGIKKDENDQNTPKQKLKNRQLRIQKID